MESADRHPRNEKKRTWLVTGAAGFIGSNLCRFLTERGVDVVGFDNFFSGKRSNVDRLEKLGGPRFRFLEGSILDENGLQQAIAGCDVVVHLAAQVSVQRSIDDPRETHEINTTGFLNVLTSAASVGVRHLIYASSCAVYGDNTRLPLGESDLPMPLSPYAATKIANEYYATGASAKCSEMLIVGLRFFNIFGTWQDSKGGYAAVIPRWIDACLYNQQPVLYGDGSATRDFCHVDNVCEAIWGITQNGADLPHGVYNVGTGQRTRLDELFEVVRDSVAARGLSLSFDMPRFEAWRPGDITHSVADITRAKTELGLTTQIDLKEGIRRLLAEQYPLS